MRILIYGAGVIGCLYGALFSEHGYEVTVYARGDRLKTLNREGLRYKTGNAVKRANVTVISYVAPEDRYDFILLAVRVHQLHAALRELRNNTSPTIVTMVNSLENYSEWEEICGKGRILPAFPGAGGGFQNGILDAALTPRIIQPTTFGEIAGDTIERLIQLSEIFKHCRIPYQIVPNMHIWQLCHLALVVPLADAYYEAEDPARAGHEWHITENTARQIKHNFNAIKGLGFVLSPTKMNLLCCVPAELLAAGLKAVFLSSFGERFMYRHSMKAPDEMRELHQQFYGYLNE